MPTNPRSIVQYLLPFMVTAGKYSAEIQSRVKSQAAKGGATVFHQALSDADITIQSYLEVALLAGFPDVSYHSEEQEQSLNYKYFVKDAEFEVLLDPIDGTRNYLDGSARYQVMATVHDRNEIVASISYLPRQDLAYVAVKGEGARMLSTQDIERRNPGRSFTIQDGTGPILLFNLPEVKKALEGHFEVIDLVAAYETDRAKYDNTDLFHRKACALIHSPAQAIDVGSQAFVAAEAGGIVTDFAGKPLDSFRARADRKVANLVAAANKEVHEKIIELLEEHASPY